MVRFIISILLLHSSYLFAQELDLNFNYLSTSEGLSQATNAYIYKDSKGFVWISSLDGLNRFDGTSIKIYRPSPSDSLGMKGQNITSQFFEDDLSNLWFTTNEALNCYRRKYDEIESFQLYNNYGNVITKDYYTFHLDQLGKLWVRIGLEKKQDNILLFDVFSQQDTIVGSLMGRRCNVILNYQGNVEQLIASMLHSSPGFELIDLEDNFKRTYYSLNYLYPDEDYSVLTRNIFIESDSIIWITSNGGLLEFDLQQNKVKSHIRPRYKGEYAAMWSVLPYDKNHFLVGTVGKGILLFDRNQKVFVEQIRAANSIEKIENGDFIRELYLDDDKNLWVARYSDQNGLGIAYTNIQKRKFRVLNSNEKEAVIAISENRVNNKIWLSSDRKLDIIDKQDNTVSEINTYQLFDSITNTYKEYNLFGTFNVFLQDIAQNNWAIMDQYLFQLDDTSNQLAYSKDLEYIVNQAYKLKDGINLITTANEIHSFEAGDINPFTALNQHQKGYYTQIFEDQQQRLYLAKNATSLLIFSEQNGQYQLEKTIENIGYCYSFQEDPKRNVVWVATSSGLMTVHSTSLNTRLLNEQEDGLPNETYYGVIADDANDLWLTSNNGLLRYKVEEKSYHRFTVADGLQGKEFTPSAALKSQDGRIWVGGTNGLNVFDPSEIELSKNLAQVGFTELLVNEELWKDTIQINVLDRLRLSYKDNTIALKFVALEYSDAPNNQLKYQLVGKGYNETEEWITIKSNNSGYIRYPNLRPGEYQFNVKAANSDGFWNETARSIAITVLPPFWMTWWFFLLCVLAISLIIYAIFNYRLQQALKIERMRVKISSDLHDDVGTLLSGLAMQTELLELTAPEKDKPRLQRVGEIARSAMSRMRDTVWAIDARKDKLENLLDRMREHAEETLVPKEMNFNIDAGTLDLKKNLPTDVRQNLFLIYKEAITNIAKHSNASKVNVVLQQNGSTFEMHIEDNGAPIGKNYKTTGAGLMNMKMRAEQIGGTLEIYEPETGGFGILLKRKS